MTGLTRALLGFGKSSDFPAGHLCEDSIYFLVFTRPKVEVMLRNVVLLCIFSTSQTENHISKELVQGC